MFSVAGAPVVRSCSLLQLSVMLKMPWLGKLPVGESSLGSMLEFGRFILMMLKLSIVKHCCSCP